MTVRSRGGGFSVIELTVVLMILGLLIAIAAGVLTSARMNGNEASALGNLRAINHGQFSYLNSCGAGFYATSLPILTQKTQNQSQGFVSDELAGTPAVSHGYQFTVGNGAGATAAGIDCMLRPTTTGYYASAVPLRYGDTGTRSFGTNQHGTIWELSGASAPTEPFGDPAMRVN